MAAARAQLRGVDGVTIYGPPPERRGSALAAFTVEGVHATDLSTFLDFEGAGPLCRHGDIYARCMWPRRPPGVELPYSGWEVMNGLRGVPHSSGSCTGPAGVRGVQDLT